RPDPVGIGGTHLDYVIDASLQILDFVMTPVGENCTRVLLSATGAATIVHSQHSVAVCREPLPFSMEGVCVLSVRTAVNAQQQRNLGPRDITHRLSEQAMDVGAVFAFETDLFCSGNIELGE